MKAGPPARSAWFRLSLRLRLTLLMGMLFLALQAGLSFARFQFVTRNLESDLQDRLRRQADSLIGRLNATTRPVDGDAFYMLVESEPRSILIEELLVSVFSADGRVLATNCSPPLSFDATQARLALRNDAPMHMRITVDALQTADGRRRPGRTVAVPFVAQNGQANVIVVATSDEFLTQLADELVRNILTSSVPIGLVAALVSGWFLAGVAVSPIHRLRRIIEGLGPASLRDQIDIGSNATEYAELQRQLNDARKRLDEGYRAQAQFAANVAHELKTPLAVMRAEADLLIADADDSPTRRRFLELIRDETLRLARVCESFLLLARVHDGKLVELHAIPISVSEWVMDCVQECANIAKEYGVPIVPTLDDAPTLDVASTEPPVVVADPDLLRIALSNVIRNALRFAPTGQPVEVIAKTDSDRVHVTVRDRGPGIPAEMLDSVFERFKQADTTDSRRGVGLGLAIAKGILQLHKGTIDARNVPTGGCEVTIRLSLRRCAHEIAAA